MINISKLRSEERSRLFLKQLHIICDDEQIRVYFHKCDSFDEDDKYKCVKNIFMFLISKTIRCSINTIAETVSIRVSPNWVGNWSTDTRRDKLTCCCLFDYIAQGGIGDLRDWGF